MIVASRSSRPGLRAEHGEELDAGRQARQEAVEGGEGGVGVVGAGERLEQRRRDLGQALARRRRAHRRVAAEMPAADGARSPPPGCAKPRRDSVASVSGSSSSPVKTRLPSAVASDGARSKSSA